jgi:Uma2 family endonuclease
MATTSKILTYEEWLRLPEVEGVEEVVNGEIVKMPPNEWNHTRVVEALARQLRA